MSDSWDVGQRVTGVKHGVTAGALDVYVVIYETGSPNNNMKNMKPHSYKKINKNNFI